MQKILLRLLRPHSYKVSGFNDAKRTSGPVSFEAFSRIPGLLFNIQDIEVYTIISYAFLLLYISIIREQDVCLSACMSTPFCLNLCLCKPNINKAQSVCVSVSVSVYQCVHPSGLERVLKDWKGL